MIRKIKDRVRSNFNVSIAEVGGQDTWQRADIGIAMIGTDSAYVEGALQKIVNFIDDLHVAELLDFEIEFR